MSRQSVIKNDSDGDAITDSMMDDPRVLEVVNAYQHELDQGRHPDRKQYIQRYPDVSSAVKQCLEGLDLVRSGVRQSKSKASSTFVPGATAQAGELSASPLGDFQIVREIARGGMGVVYEAIQLSLGRRVALKVLPFAATMDSRRLQRFKNEAQAAALLHHTHIVPIYAVGCERGVHFYAMQLIEGQSLAIIIEQLQQQQVQLEPASPLPKVGAVLPSTASLPGTEAMLHHTEQQPAERKQSSTLQISAAVTSGAKLDSETYIRRVARLMVQAADALEHAHQAGVIHRDIKPGNLLIDAAANLWITDFGLAQLQADNGLTRSGDFLGTFRYMSPEQTGGKRTMLDHRTDIYSLGATFYELLTLHPALPGETHQELLYSILHVEPASPRQWNRAIPPEMETILLKSLSKHPADRYQTAAELSADVQRFLDHKPITARPPSLYDHGRKWIRRHPSIAVACVLLLAVVTAGLFINNRMIATEQQKTADSLEREKLRAREAEDNFQKARQAVDALFQISQEELADRPMEASRKRILEVVVNYYQDFIEQRQGDPASQAELTRVQNEVKNILRELNAIQRELQLRLLSNSAVQKELKLTSEQETRLKEFLAQWSQQRQLFFDRSRSQNTESRRTELLASDVEREKMLASILQPSQLKRYREIAIQSLGAAAFREPDIIKALSLTSQQRMEIRDVEKDVFMRPVNFGSGNPRPPAPFNPERHRQLRHDAMTRVLKILTPSQREIWQQITGPDFEELPVGPMPGMMFGPAPGPGR